MFPLNIPSEPQPDPVKAAELLRSLPTLDEGMLKRVDRIHAAEGGDEENKGWKCAVCLEGADGDDVKALPCNHLFHQTCLEPWFTTRHTW
jgi:hypothetical protein